MLSFRQVCREFQKQSVESVEIREKEKQRELQETGESCKAGFFFRRT
jgi:muconolactone delta-isomerase